jgi:cytochrome P450 family 628
MSRMTDRALHDKRRRHGWDKAFTTKALRSYDSRILKYADLLVSQLHKRAGEVIDGREWINYFAFDVMGDLAFGKSFSALEKGQFNRFIQLMHDSGIFTGLFGGMSWVPHTIMQLPIPPSMNTMMEFLELSHNMVNERKAMIPDEPDIMSHILEAGSFYDDEQLESMLLMGDARLLIVAGSDTTATTLTYGLYHLARDKSLIRKLREELQQHNIRNNESLNPLSLAPLDYLNGFVTETLRMHPPVPGGVYRESPEEGITINGRYIPPKTIVLTPNYTIQRCKYSMAH